MHDHFLTFIRLLNEENVEYVVLTHMLGVSFAEVYQNKEVVVSQNPGINFISYNDLIKNKTAVGRPKDLLDLENLPPLEE